MFTTDERTYQEWLALTLDEQHILHRAKQAAKEAAFRDLPRNEQMWYLAFAVDALKKESVS